MFGKTTHKISCYRRCVFLFSHHVFLRHLRAVDKHAVDPDHRTGAGIDACRGFTMLRKEGSSSLDDRPSVLAAAHHVAGTSAASR